VDVPLANRVRSGRKQPQRVSARVTQPASYFIHSLTAVPPLAGLRGRAGLPAARPCLAVRRDGASITFRIAALGEPSTLRIVSEQRTAGSPARRRRPGAQRRNSRERDFHSPLATNQPRIQFPRLNLFGETIIDLGVTLVSYPNLCGKILKASTADLNFQ